ncbi:MAG: protein jag [Clostridia bacterium]|nr:protein jag [Clostridia bacterium]
MDLSEDKNVYTGKTVEEATETGLKALNITQEDAIIEIIDEGKKGLFKSTLAKVKITAKQSDAQRASDFIEGLLKIMELDGVCKVSADDDKIDIEIVSSKPRDIVGKKGSTIDAIQTIAGAVANIGKDDYKKVTVDCDGYRDKRDDALIELAHKLARKAVEKGKKVSLDPMNPYERRVIHSALASDPHVKTSSEGKEPNRRVVIIPDNMRPYSGKENGRRNGQRSGGRSGSSRGMFNKDKREMERNGGSAPRPASSSPRRKKEMNFTSTYLGNSKDVDPED